ncbi:hypothetical protein C0J52_10448 [Blattella germanica]|nr:hypothetical protein C0J52_10448 [Blattella germanica]
MSLVYLFITHKYVTAEDKMQHAKSKIKIHPNMNVNKQSKIENYPLLASKPSLPISEELNLQGLTQENGQLRRCLEECETELQRSVQKENVSLPGSRVSEMASSMVKELSKRIRDLTAEMEGYKNKCKVLETQMKEDQGKASALKDKEKGTSSTPVEAEEHQIQTLNEKLSAANIKLCESRNQCQHLKQELKMAHKALSNEVGESVSLHSVTSSGSNWRGRAQQIISLQQKVAELQDRIKDLSGSDSKRALATKILEKERKAALEQAEQNYRDSVSQLEECKRKSDAVRSRNRVLEAEVTNLRNRLKMLLEKSAHDDQLIKTFGNQLALQERRSKEHEEQQRRSTELLEQRCRKLECDLSQDQQNDNSQHQVLGMAAEAERIRLLELLSVTNRRMEEQRRIAQEAQTGTPSRGNVSFANSSPERDSRKRGRSKKLYQPTQ